MKGINKRLGVGAIIVVTLMLFTFYWAARSIWLYELGLNANKYIDLNVHKSPGLKTHLLNYAGNLLHYAPRPHHVSHQKSDTLVGAQASLSLPLIFAKSNNKITRINNVSQLLTQLNLAKAGDIIWLEPGIYKLVGKRFPISHSGSAANKILLMAESFGTVLVQLDGVEGLFINKQHWSIHNLIFEGVCEYDSKCEHAIHLTGNADHVEISHNRFINFNAHIKSNGVNNSYPDSVVVKNNDFYNQSPRDTSNAITPIDVVGGDDWLIENNFIADFAIKERNTFTVSYGAFLKGAGHRGQIVGNVVNCAWKVAHQSFLDIRIGLSLGGGGTSNKFCPSKGCEHEHRDGVIANNLILNCKNDVSIYLNKAPNSKVKDNILLNSLGIDARFRSTTAIIENNQFQGRVKARNGSLVEQRNNQRISLTHNFNSL